MRISKKIVLVTTGYPYGTGENFIEAELAEMPENIELDIVPYQPHNKEIKRALPDRVRLNDNCHVSEGKMEYLRCILKSAVSKDFFQEMMDLKKEKKLNMSNLKLYLGFYARAVELSFHLEKEYKKQIENEGVIFYSYWLLEGAYAAALLQKKYGSKVQCFSRAHRVDIWEGESVYGSIPARKGTLKGIDSVFVCSEQGQNYLKDNFPEYAAKFRCGYLGTQDYGWNCHDRRGDEFVIASCARMEPVKRVELLADALAELNNHRIRWLHFGDGSCRKKVEESVARLPDNISVSLMGTMPHEEVMRYLAEYNVDLFINTSSSEGLPVSIMEAISFGIPVIATDVGGTREIVKEETGVLIGSDFAGKELANAIEHYIRMDRESYELCRVKARSCWEEHFSAKRNYDLFYRQITG